MGTVELHSVGSSFVEDLGSVSPSLDELLDLFNLEGTGLVELHASESGAGNVGSGNSRFVSRNVDACLPSTVSELSDDERTLSLSELDRLANVLNGVEIGSLVDDDVSASFESFVVDGDWVKRTQVE